MNNLFIKIKSLVILRFNNIYLIPLRELFIYYNNYIFRCLWYLFSGFYTYIVIKRLYKAFN